MIKELAEEYKMFFENEFNETKTLISYFSHIFHNAVVNDICEKYNYDYKKQKYMLERSERATRLIILYLIVKYRRKNEIMAL